MKRFATIVFATLVALTCLLFVGCDKKEQEKEKVEITVPVDTVLPVGYIDASTEAFTIENNTTVTLESDYSQITWNDETKKLDIAAGLTKGAYSVKITASLRGKEDSTISYKITVSDAIAGETLVELYEGYEATTTSAYTLADTEAVVTLTSASPRIVWNNEAKTVEVSIGLKRGYYLATLNVSSERLVEDYSIEVYVIVRAYPSISGENFLTLTQNYQSTSIDGFTVKGHDVNVTVEGDETDGKVTFNQKTKALDIANGLNIGTYNLILRVSDGNTENDQTMPFVLKISGTFSVTGTYAYASGTYANGKYANANDTVTVSSGEYTGMVDTSNGTYEIMLPEGEQELTFTSMFFCDVTKKVVVSETTTVSNVQFTVPKLGDETGVTYTSDGFTLAANKSVLFAGNPTTAAGEGFSVSFTMSGTTGTDWFNRGGFYMEHNGAASTQTKVSLVQNSGMGNDSLYLGVFSQWDGTSGTWQGWSYKKTEVADYDASQPIKLQIVYYNETLYFKVGAWISKVTIQEKRDGTYFTSNGQTSSDMMNASHYRKLGLMAMAGGATFTNVQYGIGNEIAQAEITKMFSGA